MDIRIINVPLHEAKAAMREAAADVQNERFDRLEKLIEQLIQELTLGREWITHRDIARQFGKTTETISREWIGRYGLPVAREIGHEKIIRMSDFNKWLLTPAGERPPLAHEE